MRRPIVLAVLALVLVLAGKWWADAHRPPRDVAVVVNHSGQPVRLLRLEVAHQSFTADTLPAGASVAFPFPVRGDGTLALHWQWAGADSELAWNGGRVITGPVHMRHRVEIGRDGGVVWTAESVAAKAVKGARPAKRK